jgi:hypothetical protein
VVFTPQQLAALVETFGADHVVMGTDYPFDMAESDPLGHLASVVAPHLDTSTIPLAFFSTADTKQVRMALPKASVSPATRPRIAAPRVQATFVSTWAPFSPRYP